MTRVRKDIYNHMIKSRVNKFIVEDDSKYDDIITEIEGNKSRADTYKGYDFVLKYFESWYPLYTASVVVYMLQKWEAEDA